MARENIDAELQEFRDQEAVKRAARRSRVDVSSVVSSGTGVQTLPVTIQSGSTVKMINCTFELG